MRILMIINYYYPYVSGLSEYVRRISRELTKRGHKVTVLTSRHDRKLKKKELFEGVEVIRCDYLFKIGKGVVMPSFVLRGVFLSRNYDVVNLHLPLFEAGFFSLLPKAIITYHCDLKLANGFLNKLIEKAYYFSANIAASKAMKIITYTQDYAENSKVLRNYIGKCNYEYPPIDGAHFNKVSSEILRKQHKLSGKRIIGFAGRFVYEKGLTYLLRALPIVLEKFPNSVFALAGEYEKVAGGSNIRELRQLIDKYRNNVILLGNVAYEKLPEFYSLCDVLVLPSIDSLEAFGIVQVESMYCGTPVIATDLPGVRIPIKRTKMGIIIKPRDEQAIATAVIKVLSNRRKYVVTRKVIEKEFNIRRAASFYEKILNE